MHTKHECLAEFVVDEVVRGTKVDEGLMALFADDDRLLLLRCSLRVVTSVLYGGGADMVFTSRGSSKTRSVDV